MEFDKKSNSSSESSPLINSKRKERAKEYSNENGNIRSVNDVSKVLSKLNSDDEELNHQVVRVALDISSHGLSAGASNQEIIDHESHRRLLSQRFLQLGATDTKRKVLPKITRMLIVGLFMIFSICLLIPLGTLFVGPAPEPIGPYKVYEVQEGDSFWDFYDFYKGPDSKGSNGYINYVSKEKAFALGIANVLKQNSEPDNVNINVSPNARDTIANQSEETFIYMSSSPTEEGPRDSIRLEGKSRFNRGLFIIDLDHMPAGCGTWPAFWLSDEANWPQNGEIDILEGVNYQTVAKTALHTSESCDMKDTPNELKTGTWDPAVGIPDSKTGIPDMTLRDSNDCFVYSKKQWLNQGCVAVDDKPGSIGEPFNAKGGGVYALEWDPINKHIRSWVFSPHGEVPDNLREAISSAGNLNESERVSPNPDVWGLPYGYFPIGEGTNCSSNHFANMRIIFNLAFCGSVAGNRFYIDCTEECKVFDTCDDYIKSNPKKLDEAYWKIRGVYVYQRDWVRNWGSDP